MHLLTTLQGQGSNILQEAPRGVMYKKTIGANEDRFWDQHLAAGYCSQLKTQNQDNDESPQEFATTIK
jgi:hypothetical protein